MKVLHVIKELTEGGASMGLLRMVTTGPAEARPTVVSLVEPHPRARAPFEAAGVPVVAGIAAARAAAAVADLVQVEWWNNPNVNDFLINSDLSAARVLLHARGHFDAPWMCPSVALLQRVDGCTVTVPSAAANPRFSRNRVLAGLPPARCVFSEADLSSPADIGVPQESDHVVLGYLGTVEPIKMHAATLRIAAEVLRRVPEAVFTFAGHGPLAHYRAEADGLGVGDRMKFVGFQPDPAVHLRSLDIFFYPLNPFTYATSEKALQEAMLTSLPCIAFPAGGVRDLLTDECAFLVDNPQECIDACLRLVRSPALRRLYGQRARDRVRKLHRDLAWRDELRRARAEVLARPPRVRHGLDVPPAELFEICTDRLACPTDELDARQRVDFDRVAAFVGEEYASWRAEPHATVLEPYLVPQEGTPT